MSETIIVALITMASGVFGAGIGAFINLRTAAKESKHRIREEKKVCYSQFVSSYTAFLGQAAENECIPDASDSSMERKLWLQFQTAYINAILICDKSSIEPFNAFFDHAGKLATTRDSAGLSSAYRAAVNAMRKELGAFAD